MDELTKKLKMYSELINPNTFLRIEERPYDSYYYEQFYEAKAEYSFFEKYWTKEFENNLVELIQYCGIFWDSYAFECFDSFYSKYAVEYYAEKYINASSKTIKEYFSLNPQEIFYPKFENYPKTWKSVFRELPPTPEKVSTTYFYDLSQFLRNKGIELLKFGKAIETNRIRISKATDIQFADYGSGNSTSYYNRTIKLWDKQNFQIHFSREDFNPYKRIGTEDDVKNSIPYLRDLLEYLKFIPKEKGTPYDIYQAIGIERYSDFVRIAKNCFWPEHYSSIYGNWLSAIKETGFLGDNPLIKGFYGYRTLAKDGHVCNSLAEKIIDDWFFIHKISHEKEPQYPKVVTDFVKKKIRADWKINDIYIEYFGLQTNSEYSKKTDLKIMACNLFNIKLIKLFPGDEYKLETIFSDYLGVEI